MYCSHEVTSLRQELFVKGHEVRQKDILFTLLCTNSENSLRRKLAAGVTNMLSDISNHPAVADLRKAVQDLSPDHKTAVEKTLILAAMALEPNFLQHVMSMPNVCSSSLSEFAVKHLSSSVDSFLKGDVTMTEFVDQLSHAYISL